MNTRHYIRSLQSTSIAPFIGDEMMLCDVKCEYPVVEIRICLKYINNYISVTHDNIVQFIDTIGCL